MLDVKESLKMIRRWIHDGTRTTQDVLQVLDELISGREPKLVIKDMYGNIYCPHCSTEATRNMNLCNLHRGTDYCPYCGGAVKWK